MGVVVVGKKYYLYWGKSRSLDNRFHLAAYHCLDVAAVGNTILSTNTLLSKRISNLTGWSTEESIRFVTFWLALHDLGKFTESFQGLNKDLFRRLNGREPKLDYYLRHDNLGFKLWKYFVAEIIINGKSQKISPDINLRNAERILNSQAHAIFGHHGTPLDNQKSENYNRGQLYSESDADAVNEFVLDIYSLFFGNSLIIPSLSSKNKYKDFSKLSWILAGLTVFADWIASDDTIFEYINSEMSLDTYWSKYALPQARLAIDSLGLSIPEISQKTGVDEIFTFFKENCLEPSPLQKFASDSEIGAGPHLFIIEESTGGGKTEAAITLAHRLMANGEANGIYIGLPTMATANAMYVRLTDCYKNLYSKDSNPSLVLAHANRQYSEIFLNSITNFRNKGPERTDEKNSENICSVWLSDNRKKSLLAPVGAGTIDQALVSILPVRHQSLRLYGLFQNILIVDEVHAYDSYMSRLLQTQLSFMGALGASVILLSATLPDEMKKSFIHSFASGAGYEILSPKSNAYPLVTHQSSNGLSEIYVPSRGGTERTVKVEIIDDDEEVKRKIIESLEKGSCVCWIRNTIKDATDAYHYFADIISDKKISLFHSAFVMGDRIKIEDDTLRNFGKTSTKDLREGRLLIATQVVEQSLDIDFDCMVTDLCPVDLIIQRAGRLHRHKKGYSRDDPVLWIYSPLPVEDPDCDWYSRIFKSGSYVYPKHGDLYLTAKILQKRGYIRTPDDARCLIESVYGKKGQDRIPEPLKDIDEREKLRQSSEKGLAINNSLNCSKGYQFDGNLWDSDEEISTRLIEPTVTLRLGIINTESGKIKPIDNCGEGKWDLSQVTVRKTKLPFTPVFPSSINDSVEKAKETMHDNCRWCIFLPLYDNENGFYSNQFENSDGDLVYVKYSRKEGIIISKS
ncbi:MAG: CRISPR-associated helicase Cas3' [Methanomicrobiaceae archaeon]|nr:CRISPR-associated helicase Cas3' [Methanomicrobiaceae archaeon]